jgi:hypothetical protein
MLNIAFITGYLIPRSYALLAEMGKLSSQGPNHLLPCIILKPSSLKVEVGCRVESNQMTMVVAIYRIYIIIITVINWNITLNYYYLI